MKRLILTPCLILLLSAGCATTQLPGETIAGSSLQRDVLRWVNVLSSDEKCPHPKVVNTEMIELPKDARSSDARWVERWTLDRCGTLTSYTIEFTLDPRGGTNFAINVQNE